MDTINLLAILLNVIGGAFGISLVLEFYKEQKTHFVLLTSFFLSALLLKLISIDYIIILLIFIVVTILIDGIIRTFKAVHKTRRKNDKEIKWL